MCVIIHKPAGVAFPENDIRSAHIVNPHGFGYTYYDPKSDKIIAKKSTSYTTDKIVSIFNKLKDYEACFHFRFKTHGEVNNDQCHPFKVTDKDRDGMDMFFMHNGVIHKTSTTTKEMSDTQKFNKEYLRKILRRKPSLIKEQAFLELIKDFIGSGSKLCFMFDKGQVVKVNETAGATRNGCWVSNTYSFDRTHREPKNYTNTSGYYGSNYNGYNANNNTVADFMGVDMKVGDEVGMYSSRDHDFFTVGKITGINNNVKDRHWIKVSFKDTKDSMVTADFYTSNGLGYSNGTLLEEYACYPLRAANKVDDGAVKLSSIENKDEPSLPFEGGNVIPLDDKRGASNKDTAKKLEEEDFDEQENWRRKEDLAEESLESSRQCGQGCHTESSDEDLSDPLSVEKVIEYNGVSADANLRWGGENLQSSTSAAYYSGYSGEEFTIADFFNMSPEKRLQYFVDSPDACFNMLQDTSEAFVYEMCQDYAEQEEASIEDYVENNYRHIGR